MQAADGAYDGTIFHRVIKYGMVQGGDPLTKDPSKRALYGTGGLNAVKAEARYDVVTKWNGYNPSGLALTIGAKGYF